jgi:hypothetical protein
MKIKQLLQQNDNAITAIALDKNLGDALLCRFNKIYKNIRQQSLDLGYVFSNEQNDMYAALPLSQLQNILSSKIIPYTDNVSALRQVEKNIPGEAEWDDISDNLKKNFVFHESCHAVARGLASDLIGGDKVLNILMEESFANTCELLAVVEADDSFQRVAYEWNSYTALFEERTNFKRALQDLTPEVLFKAVFFGYLHSNFLFNHFEQIHLNRVLKHVASFELSAQQLKTIKALIKICFTLDEKFKYITTGFYMRLSGLHLPTSELNNFSYFENFEKNPNYLKYVDQLLKVAYK